MWTNIRLRKTNSEALFFCLFYSPLHNSYKAGSNVVLLSLYQCCIVPKISKVGKCHCNNIVLSEATKANKKREQRILKVHPVSSFALAFPVYIRLVVIINNDCFAMHHRVYGSI